MANPNPNPSGRFTSGKVAKINGSKGGKKSAASKKAYKTFQECFKAEMDSDKRKELFDMLYGRARHGNLKAFELLRDTLGEKPVDRIEADVENTGIVLIPEVIPEDE